VCSIGPAADVKRGEGQIVLSDKHGLFYARPRGTIMNEQEICAAVERINEWV
jgi:hypothetical protein